MQHEHLLKSSFHVALDNGLLLLYQLLFAILGALHWLQLWRIALVCEVNHYGSLSLEKEVHQLQALSGLLAGDRVHELFENAIL